MLLNGASPSLSTREKINDLEVAAQLFTDAEKQERKTWIIISAFNYLTLNIPPLEGGGGGGGRGVTRPISG